MLRGPSTECCQSSLTVAEAIQFLHANPDAKCVDHGYHCRFTLDEISEILVATDKLSYDDLGFSKAEIEEKESENRMIYRTRVEGIAEVLYYAAFFRALDHCTYQEGVKYAGSYERLVRATEECLKRTDIGDLEPGVLQSWLLRISDDFRVNPRAVPHGRTAFPIASTARPRLARSGAK